MGTKMNLRNQPRKAYKFALDGMDISDNKEIVLLNLCNKNDNGFEECEFNKAEAEYMFLHDTMGWKEGLSKDASNNSRTKDLEAVTKVAEYLFLTEQMNWKKGLNILGERGEGAIEKELK